LSGAAFPTKEVSRTVPVYEYRCGGGHLYERTEGFDAPREHQCALCGATARRQISLPAVIFKGSGFYSTDNRKSGGENGRSSESEPVSATSDGHGHSHDGGSQSHGSDTGSKVEATSSE
jgi:putative FmdB family regulatory protein